ncbi:MAG: DUF58 domain-containing protein [Chloroflexota bacterium]|nr:DUF58 domain-containing protein [Chloroflexota bacterium]
MALPIAIDSFSRFERLTFVTRRLARAGLGGEHRSRRPSPSTEFVDYRPYQPGDDFRHVDWNAYGRLGTLQLRVTEGREHLNLVLVLDCSSSMDCGMPSKLGFSAQLVSALGYVGMVRGVSVRIVCLTNHPPAHGFGPFGRRGRLPQLVAELSKIAPAGIVELNDSLATCLPSGVSQPLVVLVSDLLTPAGVSAGLEALQARQADVVVLHVLSPDELEPRLAGQIELIDAETDEKLELGVSLQTLAAYRARLADWLGGRQSDCTQRGVRYVRVPTDRPLASVMLGDLRRGGVLK